MVIDCKGLKCPQPVINTKKYFDSIEKGEATIIVDNEVAKNNILKLAESNSLKAEVKEEEGNFSITLTKEECCCNSMTFDKKRFTIVISTDKLGNGDDQLGTMLMKSYIFALSESENQPTDLVFLNGGVKLATEGSLVLDNLKKMQDNGTNISSCGTCLDFYNLKDKLAIGEITNMYSIVEKMNNADNTIKIWYLNFKEKEGCLVEEFYLITFENTFNAMNGEDVLKKSNIKCIVMPTPTSITKSCGISLKIDKNSMEPVQKVIDNGQIVVKDIYIRQGNEYKKVMC